MEPTTRFTRATPVLPSLDLAATVAFFEATLGFVRYVDAPGFAGLRRDGVDLHFWRCDDPALPAASGCRIEVTGIDPLYEVARAAGIVHPNGPLQAKQWGFREFAVSDPHLNLITFAEEIAGWREPP